MDRGSSQPLIIYGQPGSQPARSVVWACLIKNLDFEYRVLADFMLQWQPAFLAIEPRGMIPAIRDGDVALGEMAAILIYLCERHGWHDLLPTDLALRARIHHYLHAHHTLTRYATTSLMGPHVTNAFPDRVAEMRAVAPTGFRDWPVPTRGSAERLAQGQAIVIRIAEILERGFFRSEGGFLCGAAQPSIADLAAYEELAQLQWASLFDFSNFPKISQWLVEMSRLPHHEVAHRYNLTLGDIRTTPNTPERFIPAVQAGIDALADLGIKAAMVMEA